MERTEAGNCQDLNKWKSSSFDISLFQCFTENKRGKKSKPSIGTFGVKLTSYNSFHREKEIFFFFIENQHLHHNGDISKV